MLADLIQTSETQKRITERQRQLLGDIGILDWQIKQLATQQEAKYREIEAMLREQPFIQQLELDLIDKYRQPLNHHYWNGETGNCVGCGAFKYGDGVPDKCPNPFRVGPQPPQMQPQPQQAAPGISQSETLQAPVSCYEVPLEPPIEAEALLAKVEAHAQAAKKAQARRRPAKKVAKKAAAKKPAAPKPAPAPVEAAAPAPPAKRGRGRPRKQPALVPPPAAEVETAHPGNGANDLDAAFGAM